VLLAGTYNAHPLPTVAAIATIERLLMNGGEVYRHVEALGEIMEAGVQAIIETMSLNAVIVRQGSAFCVYFMDHAPQDWHDLASSHDFELDTAFRRALVDRGIYAFPQATKQYSLSAAHTQADVQTTLRQIEESLNFVMGAGQETVSMRARPKS
jgi:glutamate-1-semialdehyde 2,1-aminomutase